MTFDELLAMQPEGPTGDWARDALRAAYINRGDPAARCAEIGIVWDSECRAAWDVGIQLAPAVVSDRGLDLQALSVHPWDEP